MLTAHLAVRDRDLAGVLREGLTSRGFGEVRDQRFAGIFPVGPVSALVLDGRGLEMGQIRQAVQGVAPSPVLVLAGAGGKVQDALEAGAFEAVSIPAHDAVLDFALDKLAGRARRVADPEHGEVAKGASRHPGPDMYRGMFEDAPVGLFQTSLDGEVLALNRMMAQLMGYDSPEEAKAGVRDIGRQCWFSPETRLRMVRTLMQRGRITGHESLFRRKDGSLGWARLSLKAVKDKTGSIRHLNGVLEELAAQRDASYLDEPDSGIREALARAPVGVFRTSLEGGWRSANKIFANMLGYRSSSELFSERPFVADIYRTPSHRDELARILAWQGEVRGLQVEMQRKDGRALWVALYARLVDEANQPGAYYEGFAIDVTEQKLAEFALEESRAHLQSVLDATPAPIIICSMETHETLYLNSMAASIARANPKSPPKFFSPDFWKSPERRDEFISILKRDGSVRGFDMEVMDAEGRTFWSQSWAVLIQYHGQEAVFSAFLDITEKVRDNQQLQEAYNELDQVFNSSGSGMVLVDLEGRILKANRPLMEMLGQPGMDLRGRLCHELSEDMRCEPSQCALQLVSRGGERCEYEQSMTLPDGSTRHLAKVVTPFRNAEGELRGIVMSVSDVTPQVRAAEEARVRQQQLVQADKLASLGVLVSGVAHEINNPTGVISLNGPLLLRMWEDFAPFLQERVEQDSGLKFGGLRGARAMKRAPQLLEQIIDSARRIKRIVGELKDFARKDAADMTQHVDLGEVLRTSSSLAWNKVKKATRYFEIEDAPEGMIIRGNAQRLEQVLLNVIINACEALTDPSQAIRIRVRRDDQEREAVIEVEDEGGGIFPGDLKQIMDPFFTTKRDSGGTGLGLSVSHGIIQEHGGSIRYESRPGEGTLCRITLPLLDDDGETVLEGAHS